MHVADAGSVRNLILRHLPGTRNKEKKKEKKQALDDVIITKEFHDVAYLEGFHPRILAYLSNQVLGKLMHFSELTHPGR